MPETSENNSEFLSSIDLKLCQQTNEDIEFQDLWVKARVLYKERNFGHDSLLREYLFILLV